MNASIGVYGLGVMGRNLALNLADHGHRVVVFNKTREKADALAAESGPEGNIVAAPSLEVLVSSLPRPRVILLMVPAGPVVDEVIAGLRPLLDAEDIIVDGGNSRYRETQRRQRKLRDAEVHLVGMGISGGAEGARHGPSLMPGGPTQAWPALEPLFCTIAARADDGRSCCNWIGPGGAGHYVKMVHNGIEYGDMQLIAETWNLMERGLELPPDVIADTYARWNEGVLSSYLVDITARIMRVRDPDGRLRLDNILDSAGQKGTGRWDAADALALGTPLTLITEAVHARALSARLDERRRASALYSEGESRGNPDSASADALVEAIGDALYAAKIVSYAQGFMQLKDASEAYDWKLDLGRIALLWRAGCIIRSRFLDDIARAYERDPALQNLLLDQFFADALRRAEAGWRRAVTLGIELGIPLPALSSGLAFYDGYRSRRSPASLLQAQRDFFGAHTYQRADSGTDTRFHTDWTGQGEETRLDD